jgi:very-short-patch-repair endonuclease
LGARHAACAWGSYAWPDAGAGGYVRSSKDQFKAHRRQVELDQYAWRNRREPTESEARLWEALRGCKLGVQFRRQVPLAGRYIVDFCAPAVHLVVEVDGGYHANRRRADEQRDRKLSRVSYRVLRLPAALVTLQPVVALQRVAEALKALERTPARTAPRVRAANIPYASGEPFPPTAAFSATSRTTP